jgi:hypothetical protein
MGFVGFFAIGGSGSAVLDYALIRIGLADRRAQDTQGRLVSK